MPVKFAGVGEKVDALEPFDAARMVSRILGMGDVLGLIAMAEETVDREKAEELARKLRRAEFTLEDYRDQIKQLRKMGPLDQVLSMLPGAGSLKGVDVDRGERELRRTIAIVDSMTPQERREPSRHQREPAEAHREGQRQLGRGRQPPAEAVRAGQEDRQGAGRGVEGDEAPRRPHAPAPIRQGRGRMLSIRLRRTGSTKRPYYRVVVADSRDWRDGRFVEMLGHYDPRREPRRGEDRRGAGEALDGQGGEGHRHRPQPPEAGRGEGVAVKRLVSHLARGLVREPGRVRVHEHVEHGRTVIELEVAPADRGRVIGREGRTANAMRTLLEALAQRRGGSIALEILD